MSANETQIGGSHYKRGKAEQHWDFIERKGVGYLEGCATKYIARWRDKNGLQDLQKSKHYMEKVVELSLQGRANRHFGLRWVLVQEAREWAMNALCTHQESNLIAACCSWKTTQDAAEVAAMIEQFIEEVENAVPPVRD